jgi:hypothetical protein
MFSPLSRTLATACLGIGLLFSSNTLVAQDQIEILIVASSHSNPGAQEKYRHVVDKLKKFNPDMVFGENLSPEDELEAQKLGYWGTERSLKRHAYVQSLNGPATKKTTKNIKNGYKALQQSENLHQTRMNLAKDLALTYDRGNAEYQMYVLMQYMQPRFGKEEQAAFTKMFGPVDSLKKIGLYRPTSEYHQVFFPLVYELKHDRIYPMDCQKYDAPWNEAWGTVMGLMKTIEEKAKADSTSQEGQLLKSIEKFSKDGVAELDAKKYKSYEYMNNPLYARLNEVWNFYGGPQFYGAPGFPTEEVKQMVYWFGMRNQGICDNIVKLATAHKAKRVVVGVGAGHRKGMEEILSKVPNVKVVNYLDI